jgi:hypothetical protein
MVQFRICKSTYIDKYGNPFNEYYYIQRKKSFLGIGYWTDIKHGVGGISVEWKETTRFDTYEDAYAYYMKISKGVKPDSWKDEVVSYV